ncbi:MAG: AAA family ATPase [Deltaproteobacteria bacterium]|nr:AAA family ATPase [Deltaproteobacteria bacterium]
MYRRFFGFSENPFDVATKPKSLFFSSGHRETLSVLMSAIGERRGLIAIVGDLGVGKTTLLKTMLGSLDEKTKVVSVSNTTMSFDEVLAMILADLGIAEADERLSGVEALHRLNDFAAQQLAIGSNVLLVVDEAQNLNGSAMERLGRLFNQQAYKRIPIQVVLCGLPDLDDRLKQLEVFLPNDVVIVKRRIAPLSKKETYQYIQHHLDLAGYTGPALFTRGAQRLVCQHCKGVPRNINTLCDNVLLTAYVLGKKKIKATLVQKTVEELCWKSSSSSTCSQLFPRADEGSPRLKWSIPHPRVVLGTGLMFTVSVFFVTGLLMANYLPKVKNRDSLPGHAMTRGGSPGQSSGFHNFRALIQEAHRDNSMPLLVTSARMSDEKIKSDVSAMTPHINEHRKSTEVLSVTTGGESGANTAVAQAENEDSSGIKTGQVSFKKQVVASFSQSTLPSQKPNEKGTSVAACVPDFKKGHAEVGNVVVQVGSYRNRKTAEHFIRSLKGKGYDVYLEVRTLKNLGLFHRVRLRGYKTVAVARAEMPQLREQGFNDAFIPSH